MSRDYRRDCVWTKGSVLSVDVFGCLFCVAFVVLIFQNIIIFETYGAHCHTHTAIPLKYAGSRVTRFAAVALTISLPVSILVNVCSDQSYLEMVPCCRMLVCYHVILTVINSSCTEINKDLLIHCSWIQHDRQ